MLHRLWGGKLWLRLWVWRGETVFLHLKECLRLKGKGADSRSRHLSCWDIKQYDPFLRRKILSVCSRWGEEKGWAFSFAALWGEGKHYCSLADLGGSAPRISHDQGRFTGVY